MAGRKALGISTAYRQSNFSVPKISSRKIVPSFPNMRTSQSSGMLSGAKMALGQIGRESKYNTSATKDALTREKTVLSEAVKIYNQKLRIIAAENKSRATYGEDPLPYPTLNQVLAEDFGIGVEKTRTGPAVRALGQAPQTPMQPQMNMPQGTMTSGAGALNQITGMGGGDPNVKAMLDQLLGQIPEPKPIVSDKLPKIQDLISQLNSYNNPEEAVNDILSLDSELLDMGLNLNDSPDFNNFLNAFARKFGRDSAQTLAENMGMQRER